MLTELDDINDLMDWEASSTFLVTSMLNVVVTVHAPCVYVQGVTTAELV